MPDPIDSATEGVIVDIAMRLARQAVSTSPENTVRVANGIEAALTVQLPRFANMTRDEKDVLMATVYYYLGAAIVDVVPQIRDIIAQHMSECVDHQGHELRVVFNGDAPAAVTAPKMSPNVM